MNTPLTADERADEPAASKEQVASLCEAACQLVDARIDSHCAAAHMNLAAESIATYIDRIDRLHISLGEKCFEIDRLKGDIERLRTQKANLLDTLSAKQSKIDALVLEFCPGEMSAEQRTEWAANQRPVDEPPGDTPCDHDSMTPCPPECAEAKELWRRETAAYIARQQRTPAENASTAVRRSPRRRALSVAARTQLREL